MGARHSTKAMSMHERLRRQHVSDVRKLKEWCEAENINYFTYEDAPSDSICVVSNSDYDICDFRRNLCVDNDSYFLILEDYERYTEA